MTGLLPRDSCDGGPEDLFSAVRVYEIVGSDTTLFYQWDTMQGDGSYFEFEIPATGTHLLAMKAVDEAGNESCEFSPWRWRDTVHVVPPVGVSPEVKGEEPAKTFDVMGRRTEIGSSQVYLKKKGKKITKKAVVR